MEIFLLKGEGATLTINFPKTTYIDFDKLDDHVVFRESVYGNILLVVHRNNLIYILPTGDNTNSN